MKIAVVGTGYVGLVTGTCLAETGNDVTCVDIDQEKIEKMKGGIVPIYEPHLDVLFHRNIKQGRLRFTTDLKEAVESAKVIFLALPTPPGEDGSADLSYVLNAAREIGPMINEFKVIVDKSTVPVGTADLVKAQVAKDAREQFAVVSNPEFLREGFAVDDFMKPDRVVVGTSSEKAKKVMEELYKPFIRQGNPLIFMDERSAELTKYAANAFLAAKITFMNEIANFCELVGADVDKVRLGIGTDERIGKRFLFPGIGYGGSCFPKDVLALQHSGQKAGMDFQILDAVLAVNNAQRLRLMAKVEEHFGKDLKGKHFALWGLAFKPDTDDIREAPALYMVDALLSKGAKVTAFDPEAMENVKKSHGGKIQLASNEYEALEGTDALIIATEWSVFRNPDFNKVKTLMPSHTIFDGRNLYDLDTMRDHGFTYYSIGRKLIK